MYFKQKEDLKLSVYNFSFAKERIYPYIVMNVEMVVRMKGNRTYLTQK